MSVALDSPVRMRRPAIAALGALAIALGTLQNVVEPALPMLQRELRISPSEGALISNLLLIIGAVIAPVAGKLGDRFGGKRVLLWLMAVVSVGGLISSVAPNLPILLAGQILQGVMVGVLPLSFILVRRHLPPDRSQVAIGMVIALFTGGGIIGTLIAGPLAEGLTYHAIFVAPTIAIVALTLCLRRLMPEDEMVQPGSRIDWAGMALLSATLLALMLGLAAITSGALSPLVTTAVVLGVVALGTGWVRIERRAADPMVDLRLLSMPGMWRSAVLTLLISLGFGMSLLLVPQLLAVSADGYGFDASATEIGLFLLPAAIVGAGSDSVGGIAARRFGPRTVVIASAVVTAATMFLLVPLHSGAWELVVAKMLTAFAAAIGTTALMAGTAVSVEAKDTGIATSLLLVTRLIGVSAGAQIAGAILAMGTARTSHAPAELAFVAGFAIAGVLAGLSLLVVRLISTRTTTTEGTL